METLPPPAETIYMEGRIHTLEEARPLASVLAVRGQELVYVGSSTSEAEARLSRAARKVSLGGRVVVPGLLDGHAHVVTEGLRLAMPALAGLSRAEVLALVARLAAGRPAGEWIVCHGWNQHGWNQHHWSRGDWPDKARPPLAELDAAAPDHPVLLERVDRHSAWVNSRALAAAGLSETTPDPPGGEILRDAAGGLLGIITGEALVRVWRARPTPTPGEIKAAYLAAQAEYLAHGVTGGLEASSRLRNLEVLRKTYDEGLFKMRLRALLFSASGDDAAYIEGGGRPVSGLHGERFSINGVQIIADGSLGSRTAWLSADYADRPGHRGEPWCDEAKLRAVLQRARAHGFQAAVHAIGDAAAAQAVRIMAEVLGPEPGDHRWRLEHFQVVAEEDRDRVLSLGLVPSIQAAGLMGDLAMVGERLGPASLARAYAWREILDAGGMITGGSDAPVESVNPFWGLYASVTRQDLAGRPAGGFKPEHRFTRLEALKSYTIWAARAMFAEKRQGSLAPGKLADFTVLSQDPLTCPAEEIKDIQALLTVIGGEAVYDRNQP
ncbi:MAG: amidohydrolase [Candidatus Adiutrix sp.]|jgi:predicted amidohydrolase YtcJ|nr:amidohydrolase [Candidatus Adiutrix sp.]